MIRRPVYVFGLCMTLILLMACSFTGNTSAPEQESEIPANSQTEVTTDLTITTETDESVESSEPITSTGGMPVAGAGLCANAYYPVREGSSWSYIDSGSMAGDVNFTDTITSIRDDGFTLTTKFDNLTRTQEWSCTPDGLVALQLGGGLSTQSVGLIIETQSASGVTYPIAISAGDIWNHSIEFTGTMDMAGTPAEAVGTATSDFTAIGTESVTTPAGTFDAMKIQVETVLDYKVTFQGIEVPVTFTSSTTSWYAQGVGWIKSEGSGSLRDVAFTDKVELQWYNIP